MDGRELQSDYAVFSHISGGQVQLLQHPPYKGSEPTRTGLTREISELYLTSQYEWAATSSDDLVS